MATSSSSPFCYVNGQLVPEEAPALSVLDRGFTLGDGVFETMRVEGGAVFQWSRHLARLQHGLAVLGITIPWDGDALLRAVRQTLAANQLSRGVVRLTVTRGVRWSPILRSYMRVACTPA